MIVPRFKLSQTEETVILEITAKYISLNDLEFIIADEVVLFYCKPYHLKLSLPGSVEETLMHSKYDVDVGLFTFILKKSIPGEYFENLDMIIRLLTPTEEKKKPDKVLILDDEETVQWEETSDNTYKYGFAMKGLYDFHRVIDEYYGVLKVDPRKTDIEERSKLQELDEEKNFNVEHYMADLIEEDELIKPLIEHDSPWLNVTELTFTNSELDILKDFPNKTYELSEEQRTYCYTSLIDILFAYCYDSRSTSFEGNSESGWTIVELSASLGWLNGFQSTTSALVSCFRRSLIYPLFRNFNLSTQILEDVKTILKLGKVAVIKCLLDIYKIFLEGDCCRYILNDIFIKDYIAYIDKLDSSEWSKIVKDVLDLKIQKEDLNLNLLKIEASYLKSALSDRKLDSDDEIDEDEAEGLSEDMQKILQEKLSSITTKKEDTHNKLCVDFENLSVDVSSQEDKIE